VPPGRAARPEAVSSAPCVLASERPSHPGDEQYSAKPSDRALSYDHGVRAMFFAYLLFVVAGIVFYSLVGALHY
jgi:hypothetical protein